MIHLVHTLSYYLDLPFLSENKKKFKITFFGFLTIDTEESIVVVFVSLEVDFQAAALYSQHCCCRFLVLLNLADLYSTFFKFLLKFFPPVLQDVQQRWWRWCSEESVWLSRVGTWAGPDSPPSGDSHEAAGRVQSRLLQSSPTLSAHWNRKCTGLLLFYTAFGWLTLFLGTFFSLTPWSVGTRQCEPPSTNTGSPTGPPSGSTPSGRRFPSCSVPFDCTISSWVL